MSGGELAAKILAFLVVFISFGILWIKTGVRIRPSPKWDVWFVTSWIGIWALAVCAGLFLVIA